MTIQDIRNCQPTLPAIESVVLRTARTPAEAVAATLLFLQSRELLCGDTMKVLQQTGTMPTEE